jgi:hypothetical protein
VVTGITAFAGALLACRTDYLNDPSFQGYDATAPGDDGATATTADGRSSTDAPQGMVVEASLTFSDASEDSGDDTGPPIMNCKLTQNGQSCGQDASSCCSGICNEAHTCTSNQCLAMGAACTNTLTASTSTVTAKDNCCVNTFCSPNVNVADKGTCQPCIPNNAQSPARAVNVFGNVVPVIYDNACCSGNAPDLQGYCH